MNVGEDFWGSKEERGFDLAVAAAATPAFWLGRHVMRHHVPPELSVVFEQFRVDVGDVEDPPLFPIHKLQTLKPGTEEPFDNMARLFRKLALDETAQAIDLRSGALTTVGPRPILLHHHQQRRAAVRTLEAEGSEYAPPGLALAWDNVLAHHKRGWLSSYGIHHHTHPGVAHEAALNAALDVEDGAKDSIKDRAGMLAQFVRMALERRMR
jgi:hypothetical protein